MPQKLYYGITMINTMPGACCKLHYWARLRAFELEQNMLSQIEGNRARPFAKVPSYSSSFYAALTTIATFNFPELSTTKQIARKFALTRTMIFNILLAKAIKQGGVLFMVDNVSGKGDFVKGDITIRDFCNWLSKRKNKFGTLQEVSNLTYRGHLTGWLFSPDQLVSDTYDARPTAGQKYIMKVAADMEKWATRRAKGQI